jgi:hypothetical protein
MATVLQPTNFTANWRKLPDELKLNVLRYALPINATFSASDFQKPRRKPNPDQPTFQYSVLPLLASPELAGLALEVFYTQNTFRITFDADYHALCPPRSVCEHVHRIHIVIQACAEAFEALCAGLAGGGGLDFANLLHAELEIDGAFSRDESVLKIYKLVSTVIVPTRMLKPTYYPCACDYV